MNTTKHHEYQSPDHGLLCALCGEGLHHSNHAHPSMQWQSKIGESTVRTKRLPVRIAGCQNRFTTIDEALAFADEFGLPVRLTAHGYPIALKD